MAIPHDNLAANIIDHALGAGRAESIALRDAERQWTYAQLADQIARVATAFKTIRVQRGDRVAIYMPDSLEAASAILGAMFYGAVAVPISELGRANEIRDILNDCGAVAAVAHSDLNPTIDEIRGEVETLREVLVVGARGPGERDFASMVRGSAPAAEPAIVEPGDTAFILYSAGAGADSGDGQGRRRGVPHSHSTPSLGFESFGKQFLHLTADDVVFSVVRVSTAYGLSAGLLFPLMAGAQAVFLSDQPRSSNVFEVINAHKPTVMFATPSVYGQMARDAASQALREPLKTLRTCVSGAEDMPPRVIERVRNVLGVDVWVGYGLTEAFQFVICGSAQTGRPGACGRPMSGFDVRITDDDGAVVGPDEIGTLQIRGDTVAKQYWGEDGTTTDDEGWFRTRDRFMVDADGNYYHCGRADHLFKVGGKWVSPGEVEHALLAHEAVWECAVIGADDEDGLIKPLAFVVPNIGHDPGDDLSEELREFVKNELAPYKYPRWIEFVDELPKGPQGKTLRYKLRERIKAGRAGRRAETASPT